MVKRTFITSDLGDNSLPKWATWVKVVVDGKSNVPSIKASDEYGSS